jgi:deoxyribonuclease-1
MAQTAQALLSDFTHAAVRIAGVWLVDAGGDLLQKGGDLLERWLERSAGIELGGVLPELGQYLPDLDLLLGDLLGDWWPRPALPAGGGDLPRVAGSFAAAKDLLYERVYRGHRMTAYCGCRYNGRGRVDLGSCGLERYAREERARRVEAEHVFPAAQFGEFRRCWRQPAAYRACREDDGDLVSGRECCLRVDRTFAVAHNDLQNLIPAVGLINGDRRDYRWGTALTGERYGACAIRIDARRRRAQPPDALRGDIARIMLYMRDTYGLRLPYLDEQRYRAWNNLDPPDAWELERHKRIARLQRMENPYVVAYRQL